MPLNRTSYKNSLLKLFREMRDRTTDADEEFAERFTSITEDFIKSGTVRTKVTTTGTATNHTGLGTGNIE